MQLWLAGGELLEHAIDHVGGVDRAVVGDVVGQAPEVECTEHHGSRIPLAESGAVFVAVLIDIIQHGNSCLCHSCVFFMVLIMRPTTPGGRLPLVCVTSALITGTKVRNFPDIRKYLGKFFCPYFQVNTEIIWLLFGVFGEKDYLCRRIRQTTIINKSKTINNYEETILTVPPCAPARGGKRTGCRGD